MLTITRRICWNFFQCS